MKAETSCDVSLGVTERHHILSSDPSSNVSQIFEKRPEASLQQYLCEMKQKTIYLECGTVLLIPVSITLNLTKS